MAVATFKKTDLLAVLEDDCETLEKVSDTIAGKGRWSLHYTLLFRNKSDNRFYEVAYSRGATESQDEGPFEYEKDDIRCVEVRPVEKVVTVYERVAEGA